MHLSNSKSLYIIINTFSNSELFYTISNACSNPEIPYRNINAFGLKLHQIYKQNFFNVCASFTACTEKIVHLLFLHFCNGQNYFYCYQDLEE